MSVTDEKNFDIIVVGAGIIGLTLAYELSKRSLKVCVIEAGEIGGGASGAAAGMLTPSFEKAAWSSQTEDTLEQVANLSLGLWPALAEELETQTGLAVGLDLSGALGFADDPLYESELIGLNLASSAKWVQFDETGTISAEGKRRGLFYAGEGQVSPRGACAALAQLIQNRGVVLRLNSPVLQILQSFGQVEGVELESGEVFHADKVVITSGVGARALWQEETTCPIFPVKGQAVMLDPGSFVWHGPKVLRAAGCYLCVKSNNQILVGATEEPFLEDVVNDEALIQPLLESAEIFMSEIRKFIRLKEWAGLRPATRDHAPVIDASRAVENLFYAVGHHRNGVLLAPVTAKLMTSILMCEAQPNQAFAISRFAIL